MDTGKLRILRWPKFSLRTLFVLVTLLACWLGYASNWARQRHALLARHREFDRSQEKEGVFYNSISVHRNCGCFPRSLPWSLWLLGEQSHTDVQLHFVSQSASPDENDFKEEIVLARGLFPEANINWYALIPSDDDPLSQLIELDLSADEATAEE